MTIHLHTWGDLACFTRPEMKVERVSYPVITPSCDIVEAEAAHASKSAWKMSATSRLDCCGGRSRGGGLVF